MILVEDPCMHGWIVDRHQGFDTPIHVPHHPVGRTDIDARMPARQRMAIAEHADAAVLQEAADDRFDADVLRQADNAGPQAADAAHHAHHLHPCARCLVEQVDQRLVDQRIQFQPDPGRFAGMGECDLPLDEVGEHRSHGQRAERQGIHQRGLRIAGHEIEQPCGVACQVRIGGEERKVRVDARRDRMIVPGAEMRIRSYAGAFTPHHERSFACVFSSAKP